VSIGSVTRRAFLHLTAAATLASSVGCPRPIRRSVRVFKRSGRGRHVSQAAKKHNANRLYRTESAASADAPHPGDNSKVVAIEISRDRFDELFGPNDTVVDLRRL
jgi:hypothetical protein